MFESSSTSKPLRGRAAFQRYRLIRRIARGGMAEVYLAVLRGAAGFERRVALKKILPVYAGMEEFAKLFRDEARIWAALNHSGVVQVYDFGQHQGDHWIAMEFVDGPDLEEVLDRCRRRGIHPPVDVVIHLGHRLASALEYAHGVTDPEGEDLGLIHRDVSPPNILLSVQGEVKLTDFGVAKAAVRDSATRPGVLRGKYAYMSPEQVLHKRIDHRSDLFGLGILLYETLTGVNPFEGSTDYQTIESVGRAEVEPAGFLRPDTPAELDRILLGLLEPDPELRYQTGGELRRDLAALMLERPDADEPALLVEFLRELFPERAPQAQSGDTSNPGAPLWEAFAHVVSAYDVPVPERFPEGPGAAVRLEERPPLRDSLWVSAPPSGDGWGAVSTEETASGVPDDLRLEPPATSQRATSDWDGITGSEWSVEGEDPEESLQPTQPAVPVPVRLLAEHVTLPPLPWADDPADEVRHPHEDADQSEDDDLEDTDPGRAPVDGPTPSRWDISLEWDADGGPTPSEPNPQAQVAREPSEWAEASAPPPEADPPSGPLPVPEAPPPAVDALLDHVRVDPERTDLGLPELNEWDLGESAFGPALDEEPPTHREPDEEPPPRAEPEDEPEPDPSVAPDPPAAPEPPAPEPPPAPDPPSAPDPPPASDLPEPEGLALMPTAGAKASKLPDGPIRPTPVSEVGKPAVARGTDVPVAPSIRSGHRRRGRARGRTSPGEEAPVRAKRADVDLGLADDLPDRPVEEVEAEQRALERARGKPLSRSAVAVAAALLFALPIGLLTGARRLERIQRDRAVPVVALIPEGDVPGAGAAEALPLLQPLPPLRAPEPVEP